MGLGLELDFLPRPRGLLRTRAGAEDLARALVVEAQHSWPLLDGWARAEQGDKGWFVTLVPAEESVRFEPVGKHVRISARTSTCGPGYHAFLVEHLDRLAQHDGGEWLAAPAAGETPTLDETEYFESRDFGRLQQAMSGWLRALAVSIDRSEISCPSRICMSLDTPDPVEPAFLTPTALRQREYFTELARLGGEPLAQAASGWFAWWEEGTRGAAAGLARTLLFGLPWRVPASAAERADLRLALACLESLPPETAFGADRTSTLAEEVRALLVPGAVDREPRAGGFGYRRAAVRLQPFARCELLLPGFWHAGSEDEPAVAHYWHGDRSVRVSSHTVEEEGRPRPADSLLDWVRSKRPREALRSCAWSVNGDVGLGWVARDETEGCFALTVFKVADGVLLHGTIAYQTERDHAWAESTAASLRIKL